MADNVGITENGTKIILADEITHPQLGVGSAQVIKLVDGTTNGTTPLIINSDGTVGIRSERSVAAVSMTEIVGTRTASLVGTTRQANDSSINGVQVMLRAGTVTGTTPTLSLYLEGSEDGVNFFRIGATGNLTTSNGALSLIASPNSPTLTSAANTPSSACHTLPAFWRVGLTIGGTTPSFTIASCHFRYLKI